MKKWFWVVGCDNTTDDPFVGDEAELGCDDAELRTGGKIDSWPGTAFVKATRPENDREPDDVLQSCLNLPIYSLGLRTALDANGVTGIQYLPIRVIRPCGELIPGF